MFNVEHPVFCWVYRASRCWQGIADIIPPLRGQHRGQSPRSSRPGTSSSGIALTSFGESEDYGLQFKKMFLAAAGDLADAIQEPLQNIGILYEDIINTGTLKKKTRKPFRRSPKPNVLDRTERASRIDLFGRGQLLFLIRRATRQESIKIQSTGYRFAAISNVIEFLAGSMEVTCKELLPRLERMQVQAGRNNMLDPGVHLAFFALRPIMKGFEVLVRSDAKNLLPTVQLTHPKLNEWHFDILRLLDDRTAHDCKESIAHVLPTTINVEEFDFLEGLYSSIQTLMTQIPNELRSGARLMARSFRAPCRGTIANPQPDRA